MMMRYNALGLIEQSAQTLDRHDDGGRAFALREMAENLKKVGQGPELWPEFAQLYCLLPADLDRKAA